MEYPEFMSQKRYFKSRRWGECLYKVVVFRCVGSFSSNFLKDSKSSHRSSESKNVSSSLSATGWRWFFLSFLWGVLVTFGWWFQLIRFFIFPLSTDHDVLPVDFLPVAVVDDDDVFFLMMMMVMLFQGVNNDKSYWHKKIRRNLS